MTREQKQLLLNDLCSRVSNGGYVKVSVESTVGFGKDCVVVDIHNLSNFVETTDFHLENVKPYLRPMSSMTEEERAEFEDKSNGWFYVNEDGEIYPMGRLTDSEQFECGILSGFRYLIDNHFDYRDLIQIGLALPATEGMYK